MVNIMSILIYCTVASHLMTNEFENTDLTSETPTPVYVYWHQQSIAPLCKAFVYFKTNTTICKPTTVPPTSKGFMVPGLLMELLLLLFRCAHIVLAFHIAMLSLMTTHRLSKYCKKAVKEGLDTEKRTTCMKYSQNASNFSFKINKEFGTFLSISLAIGSLDFIELCGLLGSHDAIKISDILDLSINSVIFLIVVLSLGKVSLMVSYYQGTLIIIIIASVSMVAGALF
jgi:hypothetical protein